jgi:hypothetical protein
MTVGLAVLAAIALGLPLLAYGVAQRLPPPRRQPAEGRLRVAGDPRPPAPLTAAVQP